MIEMPRGNAWHVGVLQNRDAMNSQLCTTRARSLRVGRPRQVETAVPYLRCEVLGSCDGRRGRDGQEGVLKVRRVIEHLM